MTEKEKKEFFDDAWKIAMSVPVCELLKPNDLTVQRFMEARKISEGAARVALEKKVREGVFIKVRCYTPSGAHPVAYRLKGKA